VAYRCLHIFQHLPSLPNGLLLEEIFRSRPKTKIFNTFWRFRKRKKKDPNPHLRADSQGGSGDPSSWSPFVSPGHR